MKFSTWPAFLLLLVWLFLGGFSCGKSGSPEPVPLSSLERCDDSEIIFDGNQTFDKPPETNPPSDQFHAIDEWQSSSWSEILGMRGRDHMHPVGNFPTEFWIEEYEPAIFDILIGKKTSDGPQTFELMVLVDFEPVQFGVQGVPDRSSYANFDDIAEELELQEIYEFRLEETEARVLSVFLPPSSFPKVGTQDIRININQKLDPDPDRLMVTRRIFPGGIYAVIHRGAEGCTTPDLREIATESFHKSDDEVLFSFVRWRHSKTLLEPSEAHFQRPAEFPSPPNYSSALSGVFEIDSPRFELNAHLMADSEGINQQEEFVGVFVNGNFDADASGVVRIPSSMDSLETGISFPFEIDLSNSTGDTTSVQLARFPRPHNLPSCSLFQCDFTYSNKIFVKLVD